MATDALYHVDEIREVIETVMFTACVRDENPVSIIIVGPSGIGKSKMLTRYESESLHHTDSVSSQGLFDIGSRDTKGDVRFLLMPDMNPTLSRRPATVQATIANLLSFTSDGTVRVDDGRENKQCKHAPIGIITAATDEIYSKQAKKWFALGLRRRIIPVFFKYTKETTRKLQELVREERIHSTPAPVIKINLSQRARPNVPREMLAMIEGLSMQFSVLLGKLYAREGEIKKWYVREVVPIAPQITLTNLVRAHALKNKRAIASVEDYSFAVRFLDFCDPEHPREI